MLIRRSMLALLLLSFPPIFSFAQLRWKKVDSLFAPLPASLHVFKTSDSLGGAPCIAYYASVSVRDKHLQFAAESTSGNPYTADQYFQLEQEPLLLLNCSFFSFETGRNLSLLMQNGKMVDYNIITLKGTGPDSMLYYYPTRSAIGINRKRQVDIAWIFNDPLFRWPYAFEKAPVIARGTDPAPSILDMRDINWKWWKMRTAVGGGPCLLHDGKIWITNKEEQMFVGEEDRKSPRTAMGYTRDQRLIILVIQGRFPGEAEGATLAQEARILKDLNCVEALNLNGGGSSFMLINGKETIRPADKSGQRPVPAVFMVKELKDLLH